MPETHLLEKLQLPEIQHDFLITPRINLVSITFEECTLHLKGECFWWCIYCRISNLSCTVKTSDMPEYNLFKALEKIQPIALDIMNLIMKKICLTDFRNDSDCLRFVILTSSFIIESVSWFVLVTMCFCPF